MWLLNESSDEQLQDADRRGLSRELARIGLTLNTYTQWYWKIDLHNLLHFLKLRVDSHAQYEIREYARIILEIVRRWVPITHEAFLEYQLNSVTLSATAVQLVRQLLRGQALRSEDVGLSKGEWEDLSRIFELK